MSYPQMMEVKDVHKMCHCLKALKKYMLLKKQGLVFEDEVIGPAQVQKLIDFFYVEDRKEVKKRIKQ